MKRSMNSSRNHSKALKRFKMNAEMEAYRDQDLSFIPVKANSDQLPLWVGQLKQKFYKKSTSSGYVKQKDQAEYVVNLLLESFSPNYKLAKDFIINIAEPKSRQQFLHNYEINPASLNAAITLGMTAEEIISGLNRFNKLQTIPMDVENYIKKTSQSFGKAKLVLKDNRYFIEAETENVIEYYKAMKNLEDCWIFGREDDSDNDNETNASTKAFQNGEMEEEDQEEESELQKLVKIPKHEDFIEKYEDFINEVEEGEKKKVKKKLYKLEIDARKIDIVKKERTLMSNEEKFKYMLTQEYDYKKVNEENPELEISLKTTIKIRPYQEKALSRMFVQGRARSGIIVLPCGAGKTLVGIVATSRVQKRTLVLCINNITVKQWEKQFLQFSTINPNKIFKFISETRDQTIPDLAKEASVVISTYTMISKSDEGRSKYSKEFITRLGEVEWGLLVLDEVQVAPAEVFKKAFLTKTKSHCKLGLTATLVREDNKIEDLQFYIGPKLYEENWADLTEQGYLARVKCLEIRVRMSEEFLKEYRKKNDMGKNKRIFLYTGNPNKFFALQYLIKVHLGRGDKILVFIDSIDILIQYAKILKQPYICGELKQYEREKLLQFFQDLDNWNVLFVSRVGDVGIDLPDANVAIEVSSQFGSRRQEAQRLGRILRPKEHNIEKFQSYFYSLVSSETDEVRYAVKRQKFLVKQGYSFKIIEEKNLPYNMNEGMKRRMKMSKKSEQVDYLERLMSLSMRRERDVAEGPKATQKTINVTKKTILKSGDVYYEDN